ncbi:H-NS family histone-like protein [Aeromonas sobria]|uniref:H-NS family histone-like protein n=1 Tax=Aeromonas sobria TaxID=646 RepID=UPI000C6E7FEA|nr:hypothetical protein [Aeromonas sobria]PKQ78113.1 hypothetical protein CJF47_07480 [Aeromonas sobria]
MSTETVKLISNIRSVRVLARELGFEAFAAIVEKFNEVHQEMKKDFEAEANKKAALDKSIQEFMANIPEDLKADVLARIAETALPQVEAKEGKVRKERVSETITVKVKDQVLDIKMSGKVPTEIAKIMEEAGFTTKERKQFVEKFKV